MPAVQRIIDLSLLVFVAVLWGILLVSGWAAPLEARTLPSAGSTRAEVFDPSGTVAGQIRNQRGDPVPGARIQLFQPGSEEPLLATAPPSSGVVR